MFLFFLILCFGAAAIGQHFTLPSIPSWYAQIEKPSFNPPNWIFGPVWTFLYFTMAISAWWIWKKVGFSFLATLVFLLQLSLNVLWSVFFFGWHRPDLALINIFFLWFSIGLTLFVFYKIDKKAGLILIFYWIWVSFAALLNYSIWKLNS